MFCCVCCTGDEPLYTQEVDCTAGAVFAAHARHTVVLQPHEALADCFGSDEPGAEGELTFEVRTCTGLCVCNKEQTANLSMESGKCC